MWDIVLIVVVALTPVILSLLYFAESDNKNNRAVALFIRFVRKCACFVLKCLSLFLVGDIKFVSEMEKDVEKDNAGA
jgi:hypothetical protein